MITHTDRTFGSLLGLVFADAIGSRFEGMDAQQLRSKYVDKSAVLDHALAREQLQYTDDGQMALALAEFLTDHSTIQCDQLMQRFVEAYESWRGYGRGARVLIEAFRDNAEYEFMAEHLFPGGSLGNGAAMRSAPVGLRFYPEIENTWIEAKNSAWPTHRHELGIEGAQLIAAATLFSISEPEVNPAKLARFLRPLCTTVVFQNRIERLSVITTDCEIDQFGNGIEAHESVVTALACFALYPDDFRQAVGTALWQGGDTDTIAAMTGALVGAHIGAGFADVLPVHRMEQGEPFIAYLHKLSERLAAACQDNV